MEQRPRREHRREPRVPEAPVALDSRGEALFALLPQVLTDFDVEIGWGSEGGGRQRARRPSNTVHLQGVAGLEQFVRGYDTNYPSMAGFWDAAYTRTKNGINCVLDPDRRRIQVAGTNQASLESNADYQVESLGHSVPPNLRHLPVEDAGDVGGGS